MMFKLIFICALLVKMCMSYVAPSTNCDDLELPRDGELCWLRLYLEQLKGERDPDFIELQDLEKRNDGINSALYSMYVNRHQGKRNAELRAYELPPYGPQETQKRNEVSSALYSLLMNPNSRHTRNSKYSNRKN